MTGKELTFEALQIGKDDLSWQIGYRDTMPETRVMTIISEVMSEVSKIAIPCFCYEVKRGILGNRSLLVGKVNLSIGSMVARQLLKSEGFVIFVATAGMEFELFQRQLSEDGDMLKIFVVDALGSLIAERCADLMEQSLQDSIDKLGWKHTNRFSPGYCNWHVKEQPLLFSLLGEKPCGVLLNENCLMTPIKSVSGIVGIGSEVDRKEYACELCMKQDCFYRKGKD